MPDFTVPSDVGDKSVLRQTFVQIATALRTRLGPKVFILPTQSTGVAPTSAPEKGSAVFDTSNSTLYIGNGAAWKSVVLT